MYSFIRHLFSLNYLNISVYPSFFGHLGIKKLTPKKIVFFAKTIMAQACVVIILNLMYHTSKVY